MRLPSKNKKRNNNDEPVCIALSDSEEDGDEEMEGTETIEDEDSGMMTSYFNVSTGCWIRTIVNKSTIEADRNLVC